MLGTLARHRLTRLFLAAALSSILAIVAAVPALAQVPPGAQGPPPPATPQGCHGAQTVLFKQLTGNPSQAPGIIPQTQSLEGRGQALQAFLAAVCGIGSQAK
jgi:hypothetical protein